uniref:Uncharacterized protein n=1 Tax=Rhizophora mucronata TaxID=61149 RepID=A0A2P2KHT1_RHIMU
MTQSPWPLPAGRGGLTRRVGMERIFRV